MTTYDSHPAGERKAEAYTSSCEMKPSHIYNDAMTPVERFLKRGFDILGALVALIIFSPVCLIIAICIKWEEPHGTILFRQIRIGYRGQPFTILKFRSMRPHDPSEHVRPGLATNEANRMTRTGRFLRDHHLDEFPQLINVIRGDMSFVGPRPERRFFIQKIMEANPAYVHLYKIRPGLFSYATLYNGYTDTLEKMLRRLELDLEYLTTRSLLGDLSIIFKTAAAIIFGKKF